MRLVYWRATEGNFGDDMNAWLWDRLLPGYREWSPTTDLLGIGTILKDGFVDPDRRKLVLGSGVGYGRPPALAPAEAWDVRCVRGPLTAAALGLPDALGVVDPAVMVADIAGFRRARRTGETLFVPHYRSLGLLDWPAAAGAAGVAFQSPCEESRAVVGRIAGADRVIAESLHAAIVADAFRIPWTPVTIGGGFNAFKWKDWTASVGAEFRPASFLRAARRLQGAFPAGGSRGGPGPANGRRGGGRLGRARASLLGLLAAHDLARAARGRFYLSDDERLGRKKEAFAGILADVRRDYGGCA